MVDRVIKLEGRGLRGDSYADVARRSGLFGILPTDTDAEVIGKINADAAASADEAEMAAEQAADLVLPENRFIAADLATARSDGEAGTVEGTYFIAVGEAEGEAETRVRTAGGSDLLYTEITKAGLASTDGGKGASFIGTIFGSLATLLSLLLGGRTSAAATFAAAMPDGTIFTMGGLQYQVDSSATGSDSCTNDLSVDGLIPFGDVNAEHFGVVADDSTDNAATLEAARSYVAPRTGTLHLPEGIIRHSALTNWAATDLTIRGKGMAKTVLKVTTAGVAFNADAFPIPAGEPGSADQPFMDQFNLCDLTIEGNSGTTSILRMQGISRANLTRVNTREAGDAAAKGFHFYGVVTVRMDTCFCSKNYNTMTNYPRWGLYAQAGSRNGMSIGQTSNVTMVNCEFNGLEIGMELYEADQTLMIGGAAQNCTVDGLVVRPSCRYNTFINVAYENPDAINFDVQDQGIQSEYNGCYAAKEFRLQGDMTTVKNMYCRKFQIDSGADHPEVENLRFNNPNWAAGGGFSNASATLRWRSLYDMGASTYVYPELLRQSITVGASPFTWTNTTGLPVKVVVQSGTISQVRGVRGGDDYWLTDKTVPGELHVAPGDGLEFTYSSTAPVMSYVPLGGL